MRMLFSCLVDADFLDTEAFMNADKAGRRTAANRFSLIEEEGQRPVIVRHGESESLIAALEADKNMEPYQRRGILRNLQRYTVNIREHDGRKLHRGGDVKELFPGVYAQATQGLYDDTLGLVMDGRLNAASLAV